MSAHHFDVAIAAFKAALGDRLAPDISDFIDLFTYDAVIDVPFDGDGTVPPIIGIDAIRTMAADLKDVLRFDQVHVRAVHVTQEEDVIVCEYDALLTRADLGSQFRRRYISVIRLRAGRIAHLREHGGPFLRH